MSVDERMVHDIVQKVMANMQISGSVSGMHGVFKDMNDAINASIEAQKKVCTMTLDQREQIISLIRKKTHENAEILANYYVNAMDEYIDAAYDTKDWLTSNSLEDKFKFFIDFCDKKELNPKEEEKVALLEMISEWKAVAGDKIADYILTKKATQNLSY